MMLTTLYLLILLGATSAFGAFNEVLEIKQVSEDGNQFVFVRREGPPPWNGITVKDPHSKVILYQVRVPKCSASACIGIIIQNPSGLKLRTDESYIHSYNEVTAKDTPQDLPVSESKPPSLEEKPKEVVKKKVEEQLPKKPSIGDAAVYGAYGSPVGPGFKLAYLKQSGSSWFGLSYAKIGSTTNEVSIDGHLLSGLYSYTFMRISSVDLSLVGEGGLAKATLDFSDISEDGPKKDETTYFLAMAGEGKINFNPFSFAIKSGFSKAGFAETYDGTYQRFSNPYGVALFFLELGAYYRF